ncbi:TetR/AcrR family transcriptional regulator [Massilia sp. TW-1]|uniref:TetR/AcrR family transcriptional regulator n=1 Tax=Telluria antibiotica TaxID=2717319 RepID=A0ABX0PCS9_9BURK|nr:TetR/AcrR family transcriptional regulator [Telluria antibiotica]NIA54363.1 TetR/AcrR family transcriptional regulator [Telluria antibiotica]
MATKVQTDTMGARQPQAGTGSGARGRNFPELIVATFLDLMQSRDPNDITFRDVAAAAGISHMAPYRHFRSKQLLLDRIGDIGFGLLAAALEDAAARHPHDSRRQIVAACACYYGFAVDHRAYAQVMFGTDRGLWERARPLPSLERTRAILLRIVRHAQLAGELPRGRPAKEVLGLLWAHIHGFTLLAANGVVTSDDVGAPEAFVDAAVRVILAGLAAA